MELPEVGFVHSNTNFEIAKLDEAWYYDDRNEPQSCSAKDHDGEGVYSFD
jgi:hypothetical protein